MPTNYQLKVRGALKTNMIPIEIKTYWK